MIVNNKRLFLCDVAPLNNISDRTLGRYVKTHPLFEIRLFHLTIHILFYLVRSKVLPPNWISTMSISRTFSSVPISLKITNKTWFTYYMLILGPVISQGTCDMTLDLQVVYTCHILKHWLRRLHRYSLSAKR